MDRFRKQDSILIWHNVQETVYLEPWGEDSIRVRVTKAPSLRDAPGALLPQPAGKVNIEIEEHEARLVNGKLTVTIARTGWIRFFNTETGALLIEELPHMLVRDFRPVSGDVYRIEARFRGQDGERIYGMGQRTHGYLDQKGCSLDLYQHNTEVSIPFYVSNRRYGFLWNNPAIGRVEFSRNQMRWAADKAYEIDYWVTTGDSYSDIMRHSPTPRDTRQ